MKKKKKKKKKTLNVIKLFMNKLFFSIIFYFGGEKGHLGEKLFGFRFLEAQRVLDQKLK